MRRRKHNQLATNFTQYGGLAGIGKQLQQLAVGNSLKIQMFPIDLARRDKISIDDTRTFGYQHIGGVERAGCHRLCRQAFDDMWQDIVLTAAPNQPTGQIGDNDQNDNAGHTPVLALPPLFDDGLLQDVQHLVVTSPALRR